MKNQTSIFCRIFLTFSFLLLCRVCCFAQAEADLSALASDFGSLAQGDRLIAVHLTNGKSRAIWIPEGAELLRAKCRICPTGAPTTYTFETPDFPVNRAAGDTWFILLDDANNIQFSVADDRVFLFHADKYKPIQGMWIRLTCTPTSEMWLDLVVRVPYKNQPMRENKYKE